MKAVRVKCGSCGGTLQLLRTEKVYGANPEEVLSVNPCSTCADRKYEEGKADGRVEEREKELDPGEADYASGESSDEPDLTVTPMG